MYSHHVMLPPFQALPSFGYPKVEQASRVKSLFSRTGNIISLPVAGLYCWEIKRDRSVSAVFGNAVFGAADLSWICVEGTRTCPQIRGLSSAGAATEIPTAAASKRMEVGSIATMVAGAVRIYKTSIWRYGLKLDTEKRIMVPLEGTIESLYTNGKTKIKQ